MSTYPYASLLGSLSFLASRSRPDISFAVNYVSQFASNPGLTHWNALCHLLNYVVSTANYRLRLPNIESINLIGFADANWASDVNDRHSTSGYIVLLDKVPLLWKAAKQKCLSLSAMEAEFVAMTKCAKELLWLSNIINELSEFGVILNITQLFSDNMSAIHYASNSSEKSCTKHIDV